MRRTPSAGGERGSISWHADALPGSGLLENLQRQTGDPTEFKVNSQWLHGLINEARAAFRDEVRDLLREELHLVKAGGDLAQRNLMVPDMEEEDNSPNGQHKWATTHFKSYHAAQASLLGEEMSKSAARRNQVIEQYEEIPSAWDCSDLCDSREIHHGGSNLPSSSTSMAMRRSVSGHGRRSQAPPRGGGFCSTLLREYNRVVSSSPFEYLLCLLILANAVVVGIETDLLVRHPGSQLPPYLNLLSWIFCLIFSVEIFLRILSDPVHFFEAESFWWNVVDLVAVTLQVLDVFVFRDWAPASILRCLQLWRIGRLLPALKSIIGSIVSSMGHLFWVLVLLLLLLHTSSVFCCQAVINSGVVSTNADLKHMFGSLGMSFLTVLGCILGGVNWNKVIEALLSACGPSAGIAVCIFICFCMLAILNFLTGVFVERTTSDANAERQYAMAAAVRDLFFSEGADHEITLEEFKDKLHHPHMQDYFQTIDLDIGESDALFALLDVDGSGSLSPEEMVNGCLRLSGPALAIETALLMKEITNLQKLILRLSKQFKGLTLHRATVPSAHGGEGARMPPSERGEGSVRSVQPHVPHFV